MARSDSTATGKRKLLANKSVNEPPAAHFAAIFQSAEADLQLAPARQIRLSRQQIAEHNAITPQQHPATGFDGTVAIRAFTVQQ